MISPVEKNFFGQPSSLQKKGKKVYGEIKIYKERFTHLDSKIRFAEKCVSKCIELPLYARVDLIYDNENNLSLSEIELIEPELWFRLKNGSADLLSEKIMLEIGKVEDYASNMAGANNLGFLSRMPDGNYKVEQTAVGDQGVAAKSGGPIVGAIAYAGNAANAALEGIQGVVSAITGAPAPSAVEGFPTINVQMTLPNNEVIAEAALDGKLLFKATQQRNGRYTLPGNVVLDSAGNSVERTSV